MYGRRHDTEPGRLPARRRKCQCDTPVSDQGTCIKCGKYLIGRDPDNGQPLVEQIPVDRLPVELDPEENTGVL